MMICDGHMFASGSGLLRACAESWRDGNEMQWFCLSNAFNIDLLIHERMHTFAIMVVQLQNLKRSTCAFHFQPAELDDEFDTGCNRSVSCGLSIVHPFERRDIA